MTRSHISRAASCFLCGLVTLLFAGAPAPGQDEAPPPVSSADPGQQATMQMIHGRYAEAEQSFQHLLESDPNNVEALAGLGMALGRQFKLNDADTTFDKVLALQPNNAVAHCGKAMVLLYRVERNDLGSLTRADALHQAGRECNKALDADPRVVEAHFLLGKVYKEEGRVDRAIQAFNGAIHLDPGYAAAYNMLGAAQFAKGNLTEAVEAYRQAISITPKNTAAHLGLAEIFSKQGRKAETIEEIKKALSLNPSSAQAHLALGNALLTNGETSSSQLEFEQVIKLKPDETQAYEALVKIYEQNGDTAQAIDLLRKALNAVPGENSLRARLADDLMRTERYDEAQPELIALLTSKPEQALAANALVRIFYIKSLSARQDELAANAKFKAARQSIDSAAGQSADTDPIWRLNQATLAVLSGATADPTSLPQAQNVDDKEAYAQLLLALKRFPDGASALAAAVTAGGDVLAVGDCALQLHELDTAESCFKRAITVPAMQLRARQGLSRVGELKAASIQALSNANLLVSEKQFEKAAASFRAALVADPHLLAARLGLAESLERTAGTAKEPGNAIKESLAHYKEYLALSQGLSGREQERIKRRIERLEGMLAHAQQNPSVGWRGILQHFPMR